MKIVILGSGYVGLVTGACFAEFGYQVTCVDPNAARIGTLNNHIIPIFEPGLESLVLQNMAKGYLRFTTEKTSSLQEADLIFIAVGTPSRRGDGYADLSYVYQAAQDIADCITSDYKVIVTKSTVPVGTGHEVDKIIRAAHPQGDFDVVSNPEFLREGMAIDDFMNPDRIIVGTQSDRAVTLMSELYRPLITAKTTMLFTTRETAEITKYAANAFLSTKVAFINEMADLCEKCGADVQSVAKGMGLDKRIGEGFLNAGPGYGGSCFPKDTLALVHTAQDYNVDISIVKTVVASNDRRKMAMADKISQACGPRSLKGQKLCVLGATFKADTDDMRDAPSLDIIPALMKAGAKIHLYDPQGEKEGRALLPEEVVWFTDPYEAMDQTEGVIILTEWKEFRALDLTQMRQRLKRPLLIDLRNIYQPDYVQEKGFDYHSIGREPALGHTSGQSQPVLKIVR